MKKQKVFASTITGLLSAAMVLALLLLVILLVNAVSNNL